MHVIIVILLGGFNHLEKYEFVSWDDFPFPLYEMENNPFMFQSPPIRYIS